MAPAAGLTAVGEAPSAGTAVAELSVDGLLAVATPELPLEVAGEVAPVFATEVGDGAEAELEQATADSTRATRAKVSNSLELMGETPSAG